MLTMPTPHNPEWAIKFELYRDLLKSAEGADLWEIEHIGSTAVTGLWAKPIIDIQVGILRWEHVKPTSLVAAGFQFVEEINSDTPPPWESQTREQWQKMYARLDRNGNRVAHIHIRKIGHSNHRFALLFRDYLRQSPEVCLLYSQFKQRVAQHCQENSDPGGTGDYLNLKDPFVNLIALQARAWAAETGWQL